MTDEAVVVDLIDLWKAKTAINHLRGGDGTD